MSRSYGVIKATLADIKPGAFIGVGATPQADGSQRAIQVHDLLRAAARHRRRSSAVGPAEHHHDQCHGRTPRSAGVDGQVVTVKYKDGEKKIIVGPDAVIRAYVIGSKDELKPGANITIVAADEAAGRDLYEPTRINVGRDGIAP